MSEQQPENKMGTMPVRRLIITMSLPMMISMLVQALYNVVDSYFVAKFSTDALNAVSIIFPIQNLMISFASGTGVGINALLSKSLGAKEFKRAKEAANKGIFLNIVHTLIFVFIGIFFTKPFLNSLANQESVIHYGTQYMTIICICSIGCFAQVTLERLLQSTGKTLYCMISQATGAIINIILDPIMIFGLGPCPKLGAAGAAIATVIGQCCAATIALIFNIKVNTEIKLSIKEIFKPNAKVIKLIYGVGVPSILMMSIGSVMTYMFNKILLSFTPVAQTVFGVYFKVQSMIFMPVFGLNNGLIPVLAYNYGARNKKRIYQALKFSMALALSIMLVGAIVFEAIPGTLLGFFKDPSDLETTAKMMEIGIPAFRIIAVHFPIAALCIVVGSIFQAFSKSMYSMWISLGRQLIVLIPAAWLLAQTHVLNNIWWSFIIAEGMSLILSSVFALRVKKNIIDTLD
ncbi:MAG: MATE family efflux transporter [Saccharofermentans sp.]|nr:MATE family efflux transporter [Saccharofermentans sp.]